MKHLARRRSRLNRSARYQGEIDGNSERRWNAAGRRLVVVLPFMKWILRSLIEKIDRLRITRDSVIVIAENVSLGSVLGLESVIARRRTIVRRHANIRRRSIIRMREVVRWGSIVRMQAIFGIVWHTRHRRWISDKYLRGNDMMMLMSKCRVCDVSHGIVEN